MEKILEKLHATLSETKSLSDAGNMEPLISFICDVASTFFSSVQDCLLLLSAEELLLTVFELTAQDQTHSHLSGRYSHSPTYIICLSWRLIDSFCAVCPERLTFKEAEESVCGWGPVVGPTL